MNLWLMMRTPKFQGNDNVAIGVGVSRRKRNREVREEKNGGHESRAVGRRARGMQLVQRRAHRP